MSEIKQNPLILCVFSVEILDADKRLWFRHNFLACDENNARANAELWIQKHQPCRGFTTGAAAIEATNVLVTGHEVDDDKQKKEMEKEMSDNKHSPGPLKATWDKTGGYDNMTGAYVIRDSQGRELAEIDTSFYGDDGHDEDYQPTEEMEAIVAMFTAAPDLLEALQDCFTTLVKVMSVHSCFKGGYPEKFVRYQAAIDRATGGAIEDE